MSKHERRRSSVVITFEDAMMLSSELTGIHTVKDLITGAFHKLRKQPDSTFTEVDEQGLPLEAETPLNVVILPPYADLYNKAKESDFDASIDELNNEGVLATLRNTLGYKFNTTIDYQLDILEAISDELFYRFNNIDETSELIVEERVVDLIPVVRVNVERNDLGGFLDRDEDTFFDYTAEDILEHVLETHRETLKLDMDSITWESQDENFDDTYKYIIIDKNNFTVMKLFVELSSNPFEIDDDFDMDEEFED